MGLSAKLTVYKKATSQTGTIFWLVQKKLGFFFSNIKNSLIKIKFREALVTHHSTLELGKAVISSDYAPAQ